MEERGGLQGRWTAGVMVRKTKLQSFRVRMVDDDDDDAVVAGVVNTVDWRQTWIDG